MTHCSNCDAPIDECNESQPVCPRCGTSIAEDYEDDFELTEDLYPEAKDETAKGADWPRGIRLQNNLSAVCLNCGSTGTGTTFLTCANNQCRATWRVNRCLKCKKPVDSRDPETPRCTKCGWLICANCLSCNCPS